MNFFSFLFKTECQWGRHVALLYRGVLRETYSELNEASLPSCHSLDLVALLNDSFT